MMNSHDSYFLQKGKGLGKKCLGKFLSRSNSEKERSRFWISHESDTPKNSNEDTLMKSDDSGDFLHVEPSVIDFDGEKRWKRFLVPGDAMSLVPNSLLGNSDGRIFVPGLSSLNRESPVLGSLIFNPLAHIMTSPLEKSITIVSLEPGSNNYYSGEFDINGSMCGAGKVFNTVSGCFIQGKWEANRLLELESYLYVSSDDANVTIQRQNDQYLLAYQDNGKFQAIVQIKPLQFIKISVSFPEIHRSLMDRITIDDILEDEITQNRKERYQQFIECLKESTKNTGEIREQAENLRQVHFALKTHDEFVSNFELFAFFENDHCTEDIQNAAARIVTVERAFILKNANFSKNRTYDPIDFRSDLKSLFLMSVERHRIELMSICRFSLPLLKESLSDSLNDREILSVSKRDLEILCRVETLAEGNLPSSYYEQHQRDMISKVQTGAFELLISETYFHLMKSLVDLLQDIAKLTDRFPADLLVQDGGQWCLPSKNLWQSPTYEEKALVRQTKVVLRLIEHYKPGGCFNKTEFIYDMQNFGEQKCQGWRWPGVNRAKSDFDLNSIDQNRRLWIYVFDAGVSRIFRGEFSDSNKIFRIHCNPVFDCYFKMAEMANNDIDRLRVITQKMVHFISLTYPNFLDVGAKWGLLDHDVILRQISLISNLGASEKSTQDKFDEMILFLNDCIIYWKNRAYITGNLLDKSPSALHLPEMRCIIDEILRIVQVSLHENIPSHEVREFFASFNKFVNDFKDINFTWFVKGGDLPKFESPPWNSTVRLVHNKLTFSDRTLTVIDPQKFISLTQLEKSSIPEHHVINIVKTLLKIVNMAARKEFWDGNVKTTTAENLAAVVSLLEAMRPSLLCLAEITEFHDFANFEREFVTPFKITLDTCTSLKNFDDRINVIKNSFLYYQHLTAKVCLTSKFVRNSIRFKQPVFKIPLVQELIRNLRI